MFTRKLFTVLSWHQNIQQRNVQISVIGAASDIGSKVAMLLKMNNKVERLLLYDDSDKVRGVALDLDYIPGGPKVCSFAGDPQLLPAVSSSHLVVMVQRMPRKPGMTRDQMFEINALPVQKLCKVIAEQNQDIFLAFSTNPLNSIIPFASALMCKYGRYNPFKIFGITHIDSVRCRAFIGNLLHVDPRKVFVPVIGGHSEKTIVPLFSNLSPSDYCINTCEADMLTRQLRQSGNQVVNSKHGVDSATIAVAWSINEFVDTIVDAINGSEVVVQAYTANPHYGTRFFSSPVIVGASGITRQHCNFSISNSEQALIKSCVPHINRDIKQGEDFVQVIERVGYGYF